MPFISSVLFTFGVLTLIHISWSVYKWLVGYLSKPVDIKSTFHTNWALITGANSGAGRHLAHIYAKQGINIIGVGRDNERLLAVKKEVEEIGTEFIPVKADLANPGAIDTIMAACGDKDIGVFMVNAGFGIYAPLETFDDNKIKSYIETMCTADARLCREFIARNANRKEKSVIYCTASLAAQTIAPLGQLYCSVKAFISMLSKNLALEARCLNTNIQVSAIHPGFFRGTSFFAGLPPYVKTLFGTSAFFQDGDSVAETMGRSLGRTDMIDCGINSVAFRIFCWLPTEIGENLIGRGLAYLASKESKEHPAKTGTE